MKRAITLLQLLLVSAATALAAPGDSRNLGDKEFGAITGMAVVGDKAYVAGPLAIWEIDRTGKQRSIKPAGEWGRSTRIGAMDGKLYVVNEEMLYEVDPAKGSARKLGDDWTSTSAMAGAQGRMHVVASRELYAVDRDGKPQSLGDDWYNVKGMAMLDGKLFILSRDQLHEVDAGGKRRAMGEPFKSPTAMAASGGKLYVFAWDHSQVRTGEAALYEVDPASGARSKIALPKGWAPGDGATAIAAADGMLYLANPRGPGITRFYTLSLK